MELTYLIDDRHWSAVVGNNVRRLRLEKGLTQLQLTERLRGGGWAVTQQVLSTVERDVPYGRTVARRVTISVDKLMLLAAALDVSYTELLRTDWLEGNAPQT